MCNQDVVFQKTVAPIKEAQIMGTRFRKSVNIGGGTRLNISKSGVGVSTGGKGFRKSISPNGRQRTTVSIPGTGVSYVKEKGTRRNKTENAGGVTREKKPFFNRTLIIVIISILFAPLGIVLLWKKKKEWTTFIKVMLSIILSCIWIIACVNAIVGDDAEEAVPPVQQEEVTRQVEQDITEEQQEEVILPIEETAPVEEQTQTEKTIPVETDTSETDSITVYTTPTGAKYHYDPDCGGKNSKPTTLTQAQKYYEPCSKCVG